MVNSKIILPNHIPNGKGDESTSLGESIPLAWTQSIPGEENTTPQSVYEASKTLVGVGLSVIPIEAYEGSKSPDTLRLPHPHDPLTGMRRSSWSIFKIRRPKPEELRAWFEKQGPYGLAVICGAVSGGGSGLGLEVIDLDTADLVQPWMDAVTRKVPGLVERLVRIQTPRPGFHVYYRCEQFGINQKLACAPATDTESQIRHNAAGQLVRKTLIETKGEGGYCLIPPSPPRCHPSNRLYRYVEGSPDLTAVPTITPKERGILLEAAKSLNQWQEKPRVTRRTAKKSTGQRAALPGDDFNERAAWEEILIPHGWTIVGSFGDETRWCRPGKWGSVSATTNHGGSDLLHVFTASSEFFEPDRSYTKFAAYGLLNHNGDWKAAARELQRMGFGKGGVKRPVC